jgi:phenol hydroxylase-like protein/FAD binding domain-containing protein
MNTAFIDAANLAWKIHHVESGFALRSILSTYESERKHVAEELLAFDSKYAALFSTKPPSSTNDNLKPRSAVEEETEFVKTFKANSEFTSGYGAVYTNNLLTWTPSNIISPQHRLFMHPSLHAPRNTKLHPGRIFIYATVTRISDANIVHLEHEIPVNGAWRMYIFAGRPSVRTTDKLRSFCAAMRDSPIFKRLDPGKGQKLTPFVSTCTIFAAPHGHIDRAASVPSPLDQERVYADDVPDRRWLRAEAPAHAKLGIDILNGAVAVVRPDGYVGCTVRLEGGKSVEVLEAYFEPIVGNKVVGQRGGDATARI